MELAIPTDCQIGICLIFIILCLGTAVLVWKVSSRGAVWEVPHSMALYRTMVCTDSSDQSPTNTRDFGTASPQTACTKVDVPWMLDCRGSKFRGGETALWNLNQWLLNSELFPPLLCRLTVWLDLLSFLLISFYWQILNISKWHNTTKFGYKKHILVSPNISPSKVQWLCILGALSLGYFVNN